MISADARAASKPGGRRGVAAHRGVRDPDLEHRVGVRHGDARTARLERERRRTLVAAAAHDAGVVDLDPVDVLGDLRERLVAAERSTGTDRRGGECPTRPPCSRIAAMASTIDSPGGTASVEEQADQVAFPDPDLLADDDGQPVRARRRAPRTRRRVARGR